MTDKCYQSWGRYPKVKQEARKLYWRDDALPTEAIGDKAFLPFGNGRSYGDVCLNDGGILLDCRNLDRCIQFVTVGGAIANDVHGKNHLN